MRTFGKVWAGGLAALLLAGASLAAQNSPGGAAAPAPPAPPRVKVDPVTDTLHGRKLEDPYRYLENGDDPATQQFGRDQYSYTRAVLDPLPGREKIRARLAELLAIGTLTAPQPAGPYFFYTRRDAGQNQPVLYVREGVAGKGRALVDVNQMAADATVALDWWYPSDDGKYLVYGTSPGGSEISTLYVMETATGKLLADKIATGRGASIAWKLDNSGFYYSRYPKKGEVPEGKESYYRKIFYHALGADTAQDPLVFGEGRKPEDWPQIALSDDGRWLLATVYEGTGTVKSEIYVKDATSGGPWMEVTAGKDHIHSGEVFQGQIYITTNDGAPRYRVFKVAAAAPARANWKELIPESDAVLQGTGVIGGKLFAQYEKNASSLLKVFSLEGKPLADVPMPTLGTITGLGGKWNSKEAFFGFHSYTVPPTIYQYDVQGGKPFEWARVSAPVDSSPYEVNQLWYKSKDGTRVPMFVVHKKGLVRNGKNPTLLYGYGGFNISLTPSFSRASFLWMEHGGVYVVANLRGGSEFGEDWHKAGMLGNKQNVFDDFVAAGEYLIAEKYTDREHLAIYGGSNGGLLVGAAVTQRPDLFRAAVCAVPLLDMLRYQNFQIARLWVSEYGSAEDAKQFEWLHAYSPYHHVKEGTKYPAVLFTTAESDTRVDPLHARKMAARMQAAAANGPDQPILLRIEPKAGHGQGKPVSKQIEEGTDTWSFLFWQLGMKP